MDFSEKAGIRIAHWIEHNASHIQEYENFARELDTAGKSACAQHIRAMAALTAQSNECLRLALATLD
jgi:hypothetical protein